MSAMTIRINEPASCLTHLLGFVAALAGLPVLLTGGSGGARMLALALYGCSVMFLFFASALYHARKEEENGGSLLRKIDHLAIYVMIAGTYTPFVYQYLSGGWRWGILLALWLLVAAGFALTFFFIRAPRWLTTGSYVAMGWIALVPARQLIAAMPGRVMLLLLAGGICYTAGALIYALKRPDPLPGRFGFHEVFHLFVLAGAAVHYAAVLRYLR
ncbi:MAG: hemolysin III family protein [Spirochaetes bacterium]|nr:hemolysin III family protein [Spirochaetota bacterium]